MALSTKFDQNWLFSDIVPGGLKPHTSNDDGVMDCTRKSTDQFVPFQTCTTLLRAALQQQWRNSQDLTSLMQRTLQFT
ncbi:hypothetical protein CEXT_652691 [Caerostris extrusa]|uniref:Uncharacterized protein n=1 Tax=Caerostris extrusa TaxID=172846 RepID=A0AAV4WFZ4_CAEEX|nr:hypothetical protein CEXT_652691 [Caerostris extrusa]